MPKDNSGFPSVIIFHFDKGSYLNLSSNNTIPKQKLLLMKNLAESTLNYKSDRELKKRSLDN